MNHLIIPVADLQAYERRLHRTEQSKRTYRWLTWFWFSTTVACALALAVKAVQHG